MDVLQIVSENGIRFNLKASNFQNFPGGHAPKPPFKAMLYMPAVCYTFWFIPYTIFLLH